MDTWTNKFASFGLTLLVVYKNTDLSESQQANP